MRSKKNKAYMNIEIFAFQIQLSRIKTNFQNYIQLLHTLLLIFYHLFKNGSPNNKSSRLFELDLTVYRYLQSKVLK